MNPLSPSARIPLLLFGMLALLTGVLAGLARLGTPVPDFFAAHAGGHGALMIAAFLGTVISLERAVALNSGWPFLAPLCAGLGGLTVILGLPLAMGQGLFVMAGLLLCAGSLRIWRQHAVIHTATLALGALAWLCGNGLWWVTGSLPAAVPWWMAFLVLTIAGERLELTRFLPPSAVARRLFVLIAGLQLISLPLVLWDEGIGLRMFAATLVLLALWLLRQDIARRTVRQTGLTRYIAVCLLLGYGWLLLGGALGLAEGFSPGSRLRDAALHAVFLGFVFSMIFGHAPIIFPAVAKVKIPYHPVFYGPVALLHTSLLVRVVADVASLQTLAQQAALANALSLLLFVFVMLASVLRGRQSPV